MLIAIPGAMDFAEPSLADFFAPFKRPRGGQVRSAGVGGGSPRMVRVG